MTPEGSIKREIRKILDTFAPHIYYDMPVPSGYGKTSLDFNCCLHGKALYIEAKAPGKELSLRQRQRAVEMHAAGAAVFVISNQDGLYALVAWISKHGPFTANSNVAFHRKSLSASKIKERFT